MTTMHEKSFSSDGAVSARRVYVVDDDPTVLDVLRAQLTRAGFEVFTYDNPEPFLRQLSDLLPGVVLTDQRLPYADGLEVQRRVGEHPGSFKLILISGYPATEIAVEAMRRGAVTVLDKPYQTSDLLDAVERAFAALDRERLADDGLPAPLPNGQRYLDFLSPRERQVVELVFRGATNKSVAIDLDISVKTVEKHRGKAMKKMRVNSLATLVRLMDRELRAEEPSLS